MAAAPPKTVLNVNVPNRPLADVLGVQAARLAPFGTVRTSIGEEVDGRLQVELRETEDELDPDTDTALVLAGYVAVTALVGIRALRPDNPIIFDAGVVVDQKRRRVHLALFTAEEKHHAACAGAVDVGQQAVRKLPGSGLIRNDSHAAHLGDKGRRLARNHRRR